MQPQPPPSSQQQMLITPSSFPSANLTTEQIQKMLDENKKLILAILENQNMGKVAECAQYQVVLQKNLMYLAAIADAQPPPATPTPAQTPSHPVTQHGNYVQHPQAGMAQQQFFGAKSPFQMNNNLQQQQQHPQLHFVQQQQVPQSYQQGQLGMRPGGPNNAMYQAMQSGYGGGGSASFADAQGSAQDGSDAPSGRGE